MGKQIPAKERAFCSVNSKRMYEMLAGKIKEKEKQKYFKSQAALFDFCAALGIRDNQRREITERHELVQSYSIDKDDALAMLVLSREPDLRPEQVLRRLEEYAEYGIERIYTWVTDRGAKNIGDLPLVELLRLDLDKAETEVQGSEQSSP